MNNRIRFTQRYLMGALLGVSVTVAVAADRPVIPPLERPPVPNLAPVTRPASASTTAKPGEKKAEDNRSKKFGEDMECLLEPYIVANVGSPVEGTLSQVLVDRGADVRKGQVVARMNSSVEAANVALRKAQEDYGQRKMQRSEELYKKELISASEKDELDTQTRLAALERKQQEEVLALRTIVSPINGVVVERYLAPGDHVAQEKILKLVQVDPLNVEVIAPVEMFGSIKLGMQGVVKLEPLLSGSYNAKVTVVDRVIDAASGTFGVRLELRNPGNKIPSGIRCSVRFVK